MLSGDRVGKVCSLKFVAHGKTIALLSSVSLNILQTGDFGIRFGGGAAPTKPNLQEVY
ncbi:MAG: hypothetical protein KME15_00985 [Drouetiella hepatica Uher 2000/2452]|uniref:Uncharacterized protein n=1 Tax=Drouetiella hepatica Uher 2000/2452 TaxID=904376 RepID=A0A951Q6H8_9CYAN|nr:hypothetical protein [Drouetiella hepatica Uher 2000/2452]